jgi:hypothetical protein
MVMKTSVHEILDGMSADELDGVIGEIPVSELSGEEMKKIKNLALEKAGIGKSSRKIRIRKWILAAACIVLTAATLVGCYVADEAQYNRAKSFFDLNSLSTEGLDRSQVKRVYRDITTESFSYDRSAGVLGESFSQTVTDSIDGIDISIKNAANNTWANSGEINLGLSLTENEPIVDGDGNTVTVEAEYEQYNDPRYLVFRVTDAEGNTVAEKKTRMDILTYIGKVAAVGGGYLAEAHTLETDDYGYVTKILRLNKDGDVLGTLSYGVEGFGYTIADIREHDGLVFISTTARPRESKLYEGSDDDWDRWMGETTSNDGDFWRNNLSEEWRDRAREEFSAALFVIDIASGEPGQYYTVGGAFGGELAEDDKGNLVWSVGRIIAGGFSPYTSSFSVYGVTRRYDYTFEPADNTLRQERTEVIGYYRDH